ncbi:MAG: type 1 glutamine amidotransferase domain-containing protein [Burkholderiales bacterium]
MQPNIAGEKFALMQKIIIPIPNRDFDPSEVAVTWKTLRAAGHEVYFATADGRRGYADPLMISGEGLDPWGWIPGLRKIRCIGLFLRADRFGRQAYLELQQDPQFLKPERFQDLRASQYDAMVLPGGHAKGMRPYLENVALQTFVADFFDAVDAAGRSKPVGAICHGALLAARSVSGVTHKSVLYGRKTTALTWKLERSAWHLSKYLARFWDAGYYRTYDEAKGEPAGYRGVEQEIKRALASDRDFLDVPKGTPDYLTKTSGMVRDRPDDARPAWVVRDGNYLSARWPGDVHTFAQQFVALIEQ